MSKVSIEISLSGIEDLLTLWLARERRVLNRIKRFSEDITKAEMDEFRLAIKDIKRVASGHPLLSSILDKAEMLESEFTEDPDIPILLE